MQTTIKVRDGVYSKTDDHHSLGQFRIELVTTQNSKLEIFRLLHEGWREKFPYLDQEEEGGH